MDPLALIFAICAGCFNGTFPVFIKTDAVLAARIQPIVFQLYKSTWVCMLGCLLALIRLATHGGNSVVWTWWGTLSAAAWIPSGVCTIVAVPLVGVGSAMLVNAASSSILSFLVFWLVCRPGFSRRL